MEEARGIAQRDRSGLANLTYFPIVLKVVERISLIRSYADKLKQNEAGNLDFAAKESTHSWIVDPTDPITEGVWEMARKAYLALGCRHYSLFDFRIDLQGNPCFLEAGLYYSFAESSVISAMVGASGTPLEIFFDRMLQDVLNLHV